MASTALVHELWQLCHRPASEYGTLCHGDGAQGRGHRLRRSFMLTSMKRLAVSSRDVSLPVSRFRLFTFNGPWPWVSRGSVSLVFALVKGEGYSPAHEGIRGVGAPSIQRPCSSGQVNIRAHPPVEPARDHEAHHTIIHHCLCHHVKREASRLHPIYPQQACRQWVLRLRGGEGHRERTGLRRIPRPRRSPPATTWRPRRPRGFRRLFATPASSRGRRADLGPSAELRYHRPPIRRSRDQTSGLERAAVEYAERDRLA